MKLVGEIVLFGTVRIKALPIMHRLKIGISLSVHVCREQSDDRREKMRWHLIALREFWAYGDMLPSGSINYIRMTRQKNENYVH